ncbi:MAG: hypothetical protein ABEJ58_08560 [Halodesulfurarchaeum sp.]
MPPFLEPAGLTETFATFVVSLLVGGVSLAAGQRLFVGDADLGAATVTAAIGAVAWAIVDGVPLLGPLLALGIWILILHWRFDTGWVGTIGIAVVAWITAILAVSVGALLGLPLPEAIGIPGA